MSAVGLAVEPARGHARVQIGRVPGAHLQDVADVQPQQRLHVLIAGDLDLTDPPQLLPGGGVALERLLKVRPSRRRGAGPGERVAGGGVPRGGEGHHLLDPDRSALA